MKKLLIILSIVLLGVLSSCKGETFNQKDIYSKIQNLCEDYETNHFSYKAILTSEEMNISLVNEGELTSTNGNYTYSYSYQYLNKIGSGAASLISTEEGTLHGTKEEITENMTTVSKEGTVVSLDIANSFKTYQITQVGEKYVMKGYLTRNTIIHNTDNLDDDIRFNYEIITDKDITRIEQFVISYVTVRFDSIVITFNF